MPRKQVVEKSSGGNYFLEPKKDIEFIKSGCTLLDLVLGGGWPLGRIANIVGDKSTGKTLLAIEAAANFAAQYPDGLIYYNETEAAFDIEYAKALGMPVDRVDFSEDVFTVEDLFDELDEIIKSHKNTPGLYILDSLDALSDKAEQERDISQGSFNAEKPKKLGQLFRRLVKKLAQKRICIIIISQVRDNIGVAFGEKHTRSGGKALDFYASQAIWLAHLGYLKRQRKGVELAYGVDIRAKCKKNKITFPFRECEFPILFGYGVDDITSMYEWLYDTKNQRELDTDDLKFGKKSEYKEWIAALPDPEYFAEQKRLAKIVRELWMDIEKAQLTTRKKYV